MTLQQRPTNVPAFYFDLKATPGQPSQWSKMLDSGDVRYVVYDIGMGETDPNDSTRPSKTGTDGYGVTVEQHVQDAQRTGVGVLGYVPTNLGKQTVNRTQGDIDKYVDKWYALFPDLDGIFFDEGPTTTDAGVDPDGGVVAFYQSICNYAGKLEVPDWDPEPGPGGKPRPSPRPRPQRTKIVMLNQGYHVDHTGGAWMLSVADILVLELDAATYLGTKLPPIDQWASWLKNNPARIHHTVQGCGSPANMPQAVQQMQQAIGLSVQRGAGFVYVTDSGSDAYSGLPIYWDAETRYLRALAGGNARLRSYNYPDRFVRHQFGLGELTQIQSDLDKHDATFNIVAGLADSNAISFQSTNYPGAYLRHQDYRIKLHPFSNDQLYREDATFWAVPGLADPAWVSFRSHNYPDRYLRHRDFHMWVESGSGSLFQQDASFSTESPNWA